MKEIKKQLHQKWARESVMNLLSKIKRKGVGDLIKFLKSSDYMVSPASTRFHGNYDGGLAEHSLNVYQLFKQKNKDFKLGLSEETMIICSLLHDACKIDTYKPNILKNGQLGSTPYTREETLPLGHCTKSIYLIQKFIELTEEESLIIRWHMSWSDYEFKKHLDSVKKVCPAVLAFVCADVEASSFLDK